MEMNNAIKIGRVVTESHPHFAYWCENKHGLKTDDIITTFLGEMPPDKEIYVVKEVIDDYVLCTNRAVTPMPVGKFLRKLTTVGEVTKKFQDANTEKAITEQAVRDKMRELFLNEKFEGTIEERLMDGYLYVISQEDLTLPQDHPERVAVRDRTLARGQRPVMVNTGKAGVLEYIKAGKRDNMPESVIAQSIWIEMIVQGVKMFVNIKNLKVTKKDESREPEADKGHTTGTEV